MEQLAGGTQLDVNAFLSSLDASSKRWLTVFVLAVVVTIGVLAHSFFSALAPPKEIAAQPIQSPPVRAVGTRTSSQQPAWDNVQRTALTRRPNNTPPTSPAERHATNAWVTPTNWDGMVHMQSEYLRKMSAASEDPGGVNRLTPDQIDEMEKNGLLIQ